MKNKYFISIYALTLILLSFSMLIVSKVSAAAPGCYNASGTADRLTISITDCDDADIQENVRKGACYIKYSQSSNFVSQPCGDIQVGLNDNSGSDTTSTPGGSDSTVIC